MGSKKSKIPPKTAKQLKREMTRAVDRNIRGFKREQAGLKRDNRKLEKELEKAIKNKDTKSS